MKEANKISLFRGLSNKNNKTMNGPRIIVDRTKHVIDAKSQTLGRLAATISILIQGKHKPIFSRHLGDVGDDVVILNAKELRLTGDKFKEKIYYSHSGHPGGLKAKTPRHYMEVKKNPEFMIHEAVRGMLPKNYLVKERLSRLKIFYGNEMVPSPYSSTSAATKKLISQPSKSAKENEIKKTPLKKRESAIEHSAKAPELTSWKRL